MPKKADPAESQQPAGAGSSIRRTGAAKEDDEKHVIVEHSGIPQIPDFELMDKESDTGYTSAFKNSALRNPLVPIGLLCTCTALAFGVRAMARGDRYQSQVMMRYRVGFQYLTILALVGGIAWSSYKDEQAKK